MKVIGSVLGLATCAFLMLGGAGEPARWPDTVLAAEVKKADKKFEQYRKAIKDAHGIDIKDFKNRLPGGEAEGKPLTKYDLDQLLMGIPIELEHTTDKMIALEITTDHLEEFPDYYTRLEKMEEEAEREMKASTRKG